MMHELRKLHPLQTLELDVQERPRPGSRHPSTWGKKMISTRDLFPSWWHCFLDLGFQVAGQSGQSGACVTKRAYSTAAVTVRYTTQTLPSASETAHSTRIASIMKFLVRTVSSRRERVGHLRREARAQTVKPSWDFLYYKLDLDASRKTGKEINMLQTPLWQAQANCHSFKAA